MIAVPFVRRSGHHRQRMAPTGADEMTTTCWQA
jgi:hypothetical protein